MTMLDFVVHAGAGYGLGRLMWDMAGLILKTWADVDQLAHRRATIKCGQAILDHEWDASGNPLAAHRFAHKIMGTKMGGSR